jgi:ribosomal 50S subunit-associated protein YjgA (DUF615 family)
MDASTANAAANAKEQQTDVTLRYREMIRRALVDWGDQIIDTLTEKFSDNPKLVRAIEETRAELVDPLRELKSDELNSDELKSDELNSDV